MTTIRFHYVDVFALRPLTGNPVTVVPDADDLTLPEMKAVAREFNQSETTFLLRPTAGGADWQLRSFTPIGEEVFGAGHNALGAWLLLAATGRLASSSGRFAQQIGPDVLGVEIEEAGGQTRVRMDQSPPTVGDTVADRAELAASLGLDVDDLAEAAAVVVSTGAGHLLVEVRDRAAVDRCSPASDRLATALRAVGGEGCYVYSRDPVDPASAVAYTRFFNPTVGIWEDPATGTAAGPLVARLVRDGVLPDGAHVGVEQGHRLGRPSLLGVSVSGQRVRVSGTGLVVGEGTLRVR
jgi:trans-2,3-dihydro-3-hydroxyanthranilate isomerase